MAFSEAQYRAAVEAVESGLGEVSVKIGEVTVAANSAAAMWSAFPVVREAIVWAGTELVRLASSVLDKIVELLKGAAAPVFIYGYSLEWFDVKAPALDVQGRLRVDQLAIDDHWKGVASDGYVAAVKPQSDAAGKVGSIAEKAASALNASALAGLAFYIAVGAIVVKFLAAMVAAIAALGSAVFSWAGALIIVEEAAVTPVMIAGAVGATLALLGTQAYQLGLLNSELGDASMFPGGHWPGAATGSYSDATVVDGDAEWSFER